MLAAEVAHEIGNPLNSLYLNLQLFQRMLSKGELDPEEAAEMIGESRKEVERLDSIIHQFLQALRPSKPDMHVLDIKNVVLESLTFMRHEIEGRNVTVNCLWSEALPKIRGGHQPVEAGILQSDQKCGAGDAAGRLPDDILFL